MAVEVDYNTLRFSLTALICLFLSKFQVFHFLSLLHYFLPESQVLVSFLWKN